VKLLAGIVPFHCGSLVYRDVGRAKLAILASWSAWTIVPDCYNVGPEAGPGDSVGEKCAT